MRMPALLLPEMTFRAPARGSADDRAGHAIQVDAVAGVAEIRVAGSVSADEVALDDVAVRPAARLMPVPVLPEMTLPQPGGRSRRSCCRGVVVDR